MMIVGDSGLGKTSFINTFLSIRFNRFVPEIVNGTSQLPTSEIKFNYAEKKEGSVLLKVNMIDTPGYGKFESIKQSCKQIYEFLTSQLIQYREAKMSSFYFKPEDTRVHLCLFFIEGPHCKQADLKFMHFLQQYVPILPVLAKADAYTKTELIETKLNIVQQAAQAQIKFFDVQSFIGDLNSPIAPIPPFALLSAVTMIETEEGFFYGRKYLWGNCNIDDPNHNDFGILAKLLVGEVVFPCKKLAKKLCKALHKSYKTRIRAIRLRERKNKQNAERVKWWVTNLSKSFLSYIYN